MTEPQYTHTDSDGDRIELYRNSTGLHHAWKVRLVSHRPERLPLAVWLTGKAAAALAETLRPEPREVELHGEIEYPRFDTVARAEYALGDLRVLVEGAPGDSPKQVGKALRRLLVDVAGEDDDAAELLAELADLLDVAESDLLAAVRDAKETILRQDERIGQLITEADVARQMIERVAKDRDARPSIRQVQVAEQAAKDADRRYNDLARIAQADRAGEQALRSCLRSLGLTAMSTAPLVEVADTIKKLGDENNDLRERLSAAGMLTAKDTIEAQRAEIAELRDENRGMSNACTDYRRLIAEAGARNAELQGALMKANARGDALAAAVTAAAAELTAHAAPDDALDVRVLDRLMTALRGTDA